ncbi:EAL domain-containing protein [Baekduia soli]|uniref:EAL domain-containing protein n=1 Tax=Baekduia soli TaxID=496014 RepID=UPI001651EF2A|nr:bifunctional diguanylate cyclase/phosphodiesterase [Baekduia soli]
MAVIDEAGTVVAVNAAWRRFGAEGGAGAGADCLGQNYLRACDAGAPDPYALRAATGLREVLAGALEHFAMEYPVHHGAVRRWFDVCASRFSGEGPVRVVVSHAEVTERIAMEAEAGTRSALLDEIDVSVIATDAAGVVTHWNRGAEALYGWSRVEATGRRVAELVVGDPAPSLGRTGPERRHTGRREGRFILKRRDGSTFPAHVRDTVLRDGAGRVTAMIAVSIDISSEIASEASLTTARNHLQAVTHSMGEGLCALDGDGRVTLMNRAAEQMLGWSSATMLGRRMHDIVHRHAGPGVGPDGCGLARAQRDAVTVRVDQDAFLCQDGSALMVSWTSAPLQTSDGVTGFVVVFSDATRRVAEKEDLRRELSALAWVGRVQDALREDRFVLYAQPILDLRTDEVVQRELLLRLREPGGGIVGPAAYLQIAEQRGLIGDIDRWVIRQAAGLAAQGRPVELNVSGCSLSDPRLIAHIETCLRESGADPAHMVFEITETALVSDQAAALDFAQRLHGLGCKLALDDFGTGYGGFTYLKQLPVDYLKIDIEFVRDLPTNDASRHVVQAEVNLARSFDLETVAEGVEDAETLDLLRELGVDFAQGYHIARPAPIEAHDAHHLMTERPA